MEKVKYFLKNAAIQTAEFLLDIVKKTVATTTRLLAKGSGKLVKFAGAKVKQFAAVNKQPLLFAAMIVSAAAMVVSGVFFLLGRKK
ncbi:MAG: hypothetical protein Q3985_00465 [Eubacteriales bacterium]|nr:hypothetical protein [Eubacteriales bacterium]